MVGWLVAERLCVSDLKVDFRRYVPELSEMAFPFHFPFLVLVVTMCRTKRDMRRPFPRLSNVSAPIPAVKVVGENILVEVKVSQDENMTE